MTAKAPAGRLAGTIAVVTGGSQGIGRGIVDRFAAEGASVAMLDIDAEGGRSVAAGHMEHGRTVEFFACDVSSEKKVRAAIESAERSFGSISCLVNNAGVNAYFDATAMTEHEWDTVMGVDLKGAWLCCKYAIPSMISAGRGSIINIASIHAVMTSTGVFPYPAAKAGLLGLTRSLALDYGADNIRVNAICPGFIRTRLVNEWLNHQPDPQATEASILRNHPLGRMGTPADIASLVCYLASDEAGFMTGSTILLDGGLSARFAT